MAELDNIIQAEFGGRRQNARVNAVNGIDTPPDEAARALQLGKDSGQDPNAILGDLPTFDRQHRQMLTGALIDNDPELQTYANSDPMAPKISSDDWGSLGHVASKLRTFVDHIPIKPPAPIPSIPINARQIIEGYKGAGEGLKSLFASALVGYAAAIPQIAQYQLNAMGPATEETPNWAKEERESLKGIADTKVSEHPLYKAGKAIESIAEEPLRAAPGWEDSWTRKIGSGFGSMFGGMGLSAIPYLGPGLAATAFMGSGMGEAVDRAIKAGATEEEIRKAGSFGSIAGATDVADILLLRLGIAGKAAMTTKKMVTHGITGALTEGAQEGIQEFIQNAIEKNIYNPGKGYTEGVAEAAAIGLIIGGIASGGMAAIKQAKNGRQDVADALGAVQMYTREGREVPVGLHYITDTLKAGQAVKEAEVFNDLMSEVLQNQTRLRSPEIFRNLPAQFGNRSILISGEAVHEAYGQNTPEQGDGKLGFVPGIAEQFRSSLLTGSDIVIPLADYVAFVDKNFHGAVKEDIRYRDGGMTLKEAKLYDPVEAAQMVEAFHGSPHEFDAFSMEKIGTGEGAQSYGHGLYFAENEQVADQYAAMDTPGRWVTTKPGIQEYREGTKGGNKYRVRINADKEQFLDWDKPLGEDIGHFENINKAVYPNQPAIPGMTGQQIYQVLHNITGSPARSSKLLAEAGIPGIKYLDQGSREKGEGSYNFVLFDDSLISIIDRNGQAIEAVKRASGFKTLNEVMQVAEESGAEWAGVGSKLQVLHAEVEHLPPEYQELVDKMQQLFNRIIPHLGAHVPVFDIQGQGGRAVGLYTSYTDMRPVIYWSFGAKDLVGVGRHEAVHFLRRYNFISEQEWDVLARAVRDNGWIAKHNLLEQGDYQSLSMEELIEEAVAHEFESWNRSEETKAKGPVQEIFGKLKEVGAGIVNTIKSVFGEEATADSIFAKIESGEVGNREPGKPREPKAFAFSKGPTQPQLPGTTRQEDMAIARGAAFGMTQPQYEKYQKLIREQHARDQEYIRKKAIAAEKKRQTAEWKAQEASVREEVLEDTAQAPVLVATNFFLNGEVPGAEKLRVKPKLDWNAVTPEQRAAMPKDTVAPGWLNPDDIAPMLGFQSGKELITGMMAFEAARGKTGSRDYFNQLVNSETNRRMEERYGNLSENILEEAEEHVYGSPQMDILHEETIALAVKADLEFTFSREEIESAVRDTFGQLRHADIKPHRFVKEAGNAGKEVEAQLLKGDFKEAFVAKQKQFYSALMAKMAMKLAKDQKGFEKMAKRLGRDKIKSMDREWVDFGQKMLANAGMAINRPIQFLQESMERSGFDNLPDFIAARAGDGFELGNVDANLAQGQSPKYEDMTVDQFYATKDSVSSLVAAGRAAKSQLLSGEKRDWRDFEDTIINNITQLPPRPPGESKWRYRFDSSLVKMEEVIKDLDLRKDAGPLWKYLFQPMVEAKHTEYDLQEKLVKNLAKIKGDFGSKWIKRLNDTIPNSFLVDPNDGALFELNRSNMINIMLQFGTRSGIKKFTEGYAYRPNMDKATLKYEALKLETQLRNTFDQHASKEDWDYTQRMFDLFEDWRPQADEMYYRLGGQGKIWLEPDEIMTKHGPYKGGYYPIIEDKSRPGDMSGRNKDPKDNSRFGPNFMRATTANRYTLERTGAVWPVDFTSPVEKVLTRMQQIMHDIAYREAVMGADKFLRSKRIEMAIKKHYGQEYYDQFDPWLQDMASNYNLDEKATNAITQPIQRMRMNLVVHALGLNLGVMGSPDVGALNPAAVTEVLSNRGPLVARAWAKSREIPHTFKNMDRDFRESMERTIRKGGYSDLQATAARWGFWPVVKTSQAFRIITWNSTYEASLKKGMSDGDSVAAADYAVRSRHGSGGIPDLPAIMRGNEYQKALTLFYGYFNTMYNWNRQIPGQFRRGEMVNVVATIYGTTLIGAAFGALLYTKPKKDEGWFGWASRVMGGQLAGYIPFAREAYGYFVEGHLPNTPMGSFLTAIKDIGGDVVKVAKGKKIEKPIKHAATIAGLGLGLPLGQIGTTGQFAYDVATRKQRPKNFGEWWWGIRYGEAKPKR